MDIQKEREAFELWVKEVCPQIQWELNDKTDGDYDSSSMSWAWAAWQAAKAPAAPEGFVLVPKEPTPKMIDAGHNFCKRNIVTPTGFYKAMIEAQDSCREP